MKEKWIGIRMSHGVVETQLRKDIFIYLQQTSFFRYFMKNKLVSYLLDKTNWITYYYISKEHYD